MMPLPPTLEETRDRIAGAERRYRFSAALGWAAKPGSPEYGPLVALANYLRTRPHEAEDFADFHVAHFPAGARGSAERAAFVVHLLRDIEHDAPASQMAALTVFAAKILGRYPDEWALISEHEWDRPGVPHLGNPVPGTDYGVTRVYRMTWPDDGTDFAGITYEKTMRWQGPSADYRDHVVTAHGEDAVLTGARDGDV
jgi:hypothetical protein